MPVLGGWRSPTAVMRKTGKKMNRPHTTFRTKSARMGCPSQDAPMSRFLSHFILGKVFYLPHACRSLLYQHVLSLVLRFNLKQSECDHMIQIAMVGPGVVKSLLLVAISCAPVYWTGARWTPPWPSFSWGVVDIGKVVDDGSVMFNLSRETSALQQTLCFYYFQWFTERLASGISFFIHF